MGKKSQDRCSIKHTGRRKVAQVKSCGGHCLVRWWGSVHKLDESFLVKDDRLGGSGRSRFERDVGGRRRRE